MLAELLPHVGLDKPGLTLAGVQKMVAEHQAHKESKIREAMV